MVGSVNEPVDVREMGVDRLVGAGSALGAATASMAEIYAALSPARVLMTLIENSAPN